MAEIDMSAIEQKVSGWAKSAEGKSRIIDASRSGRGGVPAGQMDQIVVEFLVGLEQAFEQAYYDANKRDGYDYPFTGMISKAHRHITEPNAGTGVLYECEITFEDVERLSLEITSGKRRGEYTGEGIKNILALFEHGYDARYTRYGRWYRSRGNTLDNVKSRMYRDGLNAMHDYIHNFNNTNQYGIRAEFTQDTLLD